MNPIRLWASGYRTFNELDLDIPTGCTAVVGPNGAGKSSILNVVDVALFAERGELADLLSTDHDALELGLDFEHAGDRYRVRRQYRKGKATLDFEVASDDYAGDIDARVLVWEPLTRETAAATQALICETIGLTRTTFRASAFLRQGDSAAFTEAQPRDRKQILAEILQLERWEARREQASIAARAHDTELTKLAGRAELAELTARLRPEVQRALETLRTQETEGAELVTQYETTLEAAVQQLADTNAAKERVRACEAELQAATADEHRARDLLLEAQQAQVAADAKQAELEQLTEVAGYVHQLEGDLSQAREARDEAAAAERSRDDFIAASARHRDTATRLRTEGDRLAKHHTLLAERLVELQHAEDGTERCDRCQQLLGGEAKATAITGLQKELDELETRISETVNEAIGEERLTREAAAEAAKVEIPAVPDIARLETDLARARDARSRQTALAQLLASYQEKTAKLPLLETELTQLAAVTAAKRDALAEAAVTAGDTTELEQHLVKVRADLSLGRSVLEAIRRNLAQQEAQLQAIDAADTELAEIQTRSADIHSEVDILKLAEKAFGRDGIPALLVEAVAVPQLESEANRILELLPMADGRVFRVELQTQAANKSNENVRETLEILVYDVAAVRPYESYSGGEKGRLNIALRIALARLLAHRRGAESRLLAIDEVPYLDELGQERLVDVVASVADDFDRVLVVAHESGLRDAFENRIELEISNRRSRIVTGQVALHEVPA